MGQVVVLTGQSVHRKDQATLLGPRGVAVHRTAVAGQVDVAQQGFGVPSHGCQRVNTERPPAWQGETQQYEDISFLLDKRGGGRWGVGYSGLVFRDTVLGLP